MAQTVGFFTDTTLCIGCKACEVACKEWNGLPNNPLEFRDSYDNTGQLDHANWRHVRFIEQTTKSPDKPIAWSMMSDVCKHCANASCLEVCPTNAIVRTEFDTVFIQQDVCNGCRDCISACPYAVQPAQPRERGPSQPQQHSWLPDRRDHRGIRRPGGADRLPPPRRDRISTPVRRRIRTITLPRWRGRAGWGLNAQRAFRRPATLGVVHPSVLLLRGHLRRRLCNRYHAAAVGQSGGQGGLAARVHHQLPAAADLPHPAHARPRAALALLAHARRFRVGPARVQGVLTDVARRLGPHPLRAVLVRDVPRGRR